MMTGIKARTLSLTLAVLSVTAVFTACDKNGGDDAAKNMDVEYFCISDEGFDMQGLRLPSDKDLKNSTRGAYRITGNCLERTFHEADKAGLFIVDDGEIKIANLPLEHFGEDKDGFALFGKAGDKGQGVQGQDGAVSKASTAIAISPTAECILYYPYNEFLLDGMTTSEATSDDIHSLIREKCAIPEDLSEVSDFSRADVVVSQSQAYDNGRIYFTGRHMRDLKVEYVPTVRCLLDGDPLYFWEYEDDAHTQSNGVREASQNRDTHKGFKAAPGIHLSLQYRPSEDKQPEVSSHGDMGLTEEKYKASTGDYYFSDGSLSKETLSPTGAECIGIVFWLGDPTEDDTTLRRDKPECRHGLVASLDGDFATRWQTAYRELLYSVGTWLDLNAEKAPEEFLPVTTGKEADAPLNKTIGYNNTKAIEYFNSKMPEYKVDAVEAATIYRDTTRHKAPHLSSDWFTPSEKELTLLAGKDLPDIWSNETSNLIGLETMKTVNNSLSRLPGTLPIQERRYWSSSEASPGVAFYVYFTYGGAHSASKFFTTYRVRMVLAF